MEGLVLQKALEHFCCVYNKQRQHFSVKIYRWYIASDKVDLWPDTLIIWDIENWPLPRMLAPLSSAVVSIGR